MIPPREADPVLAGFDRQAICAQSLLDQGALGFQQLLQVIQCQLGEAVHRQADRQAVRALVSGGFDFSISGVGSVGLVLAGEVGCRRNEALIDQHLGEPLGLVALVEGNDAVAVDVEAAH